MCRQTKKLLFGLYVAVAFFLAALGSGCGEDNCGVSEMKACETSEDCVLVSCACCSYETVSKGCADSWYKINDCRPGEIICSAVVCPGRIADCVKNQCVVK
jgi:hypothetical protein